ncbi:hypothetical protein M427DRAFT_254546 [Gonapodya prolifera JEL478]|uniref:Uncharacterized protein n=1 Tax=Gonapodya prolifera (strain JEL478) TaxID=1344416 RepID=A0A139ALC9_GONPJ|nr:hypothetical protein M427DRAFT_254546 [Gonapodya prolifera JEL478]|eukprot:KXS17586.1 hypothetical protein M427DRAFT_254546 [Gonapodya prolifera JEL478]
MGSVVPSGRNVRDATCRKNAVTRVWIKAGEEVSSRVKSDSSHSETMPASVSDPSRSTRPAESRSRAGPDPPESDDVVVGSSLPGAAASFASEGVLVEADRIKEKLFRSTQRPISSGLVDDGQKDSSSSPDSDHTRETSSSSIFLRVAKASLMSLGALERYWSGERAATWCQSPCKIVLPTHYSPTGNLGLSSSSVLDTSAKMDGDAAPPATSRAMKVPKVLYT